MTHTPQDLQAALISIDNVNEQLSRAGIDEGSAQLGVMKLISALSSASMKRKVKPLVWTTYPTGNGRPYDTACTCVEPFGTLMIEWKSWKEEADRDYVLYINEGFLSPHFTLDAAKAAAVEWIEGQILKVMLLTETDE